MADKKITRDDADDPMKEGATANWYDADELQPGGTGKQGDQQQMGEDREVRTDKSHNERGSDKLHGP
ncbi:MAG TPA: hypothetical protein V6D22_13240 [Candidatus Obscuribacterales bacterium]